MRFPVLLFTLLTFSFLRYTLNVKLFTKKLTAKSYFLKSIRPNN